MCLREILYIVLIYQMFYFLLFKASVTMHLQLFAIFRMNSINILKDEGTTKICTNSRTRTFVKFRRNRLKNMY